jgi:hypothetical protein
MKSNTKPSATEKGWVYLDELYAAEEVSVVCLLRSS